MGRGRTTRRFAATAIGILMAVALVLVGCQDQHGPTAAVSSIVAAGTVRVASSCTVADEGSTVAGFESVGAADFDERHGWIELTQVPEPEHAIEAAWSGDRSFRRATSQAGVGPWTLRNPDRLDHTPLIGLSSLRGALTADPVVLVELAAEAARTADPGSSSAEVRLVPAEVTPGRPVREIGGLVVLEMGGGMLEMVTLSGSDSETGLTFSCRYEVSGVGDPVERRDPDHELEVRTGG